MTYYDPQQKLTKSAVRNHCNGSALHRTLQVVVLDQMVDVCTHKLTSPCQTDIQPNVVIHKLKIKI